MFFSAEISAKSNKIQRYFVQKRIIYLEKIPDDYAVDRI